MSTKVGFDILENTIRKALMNAGLNEDKAILCARIHTESSADGVESHGANRVPRFIDYVKKAGLTQKENLSLFVKRVWQKIMTVIWVPG